MYAYCNNNPANYSDSTGSLPQNINLNNMMLHGGGGYNGFRESDIQRAERESKERARDINNTDEQAVIAADNWAFYKGKLVVKTNGERSGSFGILFITRSSTKQLFAEDEIRHEYGHTKQLDELGVLTYALCIGLPSLLEWGNDPEYYRRPWEITADIYGGVQSRSYPGYEDAGFEYLSNSKRWGPIVWATIK